MNHKKGRCIDCPEDTPDQYLIAGRCQNHYWRHQRTKKAKKPKEIAKRAAKQSLSAWFDMQIMLCANKECENCGTKIIQPSRTNIAHILPKSIFKSVATHLNNRWFACWQCHSDFDNHPIEKVIHMLVVKKLQKRLQGFYQEISKTEVRRVPEFLLNRGADNEVR